MSKFVRSSKFRHVFGTPAKKEHCYDGVKVSRSAWDSNKIKANPKYVAVQWESGGGGAVAVINIEKTGKQPPSLPLLTGHKGGVLDMDFNPFNDSLIATVSEDTTCKIWQIPEGGLTESISTPVQDLTQHRKKVGTADFNPVANNILSTSSTDACVKIWDIEKGAELFSNDNDHTDIVQGTSWNSNGSLLSTSCKDKKLRVLDPRANTVAQTGEPHQGVKGFRTVFIPGPTEKIYTVGSSKTSERQYALWDPRDLSKALISQGIDNASGLLMPFYDPDTQVLFLAGKGDGNIRYYEVAEDNIYYLTEYKSSTAQNGMGCVPKRGLDVSKCEIARLLKATSNYIEPIPFCVPRKGDQFQDDLYPDTNGPEPALTADAWKGGENAEPKKMSMEPGKSVGTTSTSFSATKAAPEDTSALKARVAELEALVKEKDAKIAELEAKVNA